MWGSTAEGAETAEEMFMDFRPVWESRQGYSSE